jgi:subtilase family serine protease
MVRLSRRALLGAVSLAVVAALVATAPSAMAARPPKNSTAHRLVFSRDTIRVLASKSTPPTTADCESGLGIACYAPFQIQQAYDMKPLFSRGLTGTGETIAIVDSFGSPTVQADLHQFDEDFGLPDPPSFNIIHPAGAPPAFDPTNGDMVNWAVETSLDVQWAHTMAPGANILLVETPVSETEGVTGFPEIVQSENYVINHHLAQVISQSFGATEPTFPSKASIFALRSAYLNALVHRVTVLGASGDAGATDYQSDLEHFYTHRVNSWPSSDPLVTSVGGTQLHLDNDGNRTAPDNVWNDSFDQNVCGPTPCAAAGGGGVSDVFFRPLYQALERRVVGFRRGTPDISMSAAVNGGALTYLGFLGSNSGYYVIGGTSWATPLFSGVVAVADQAAHHPLGLLNPRLYALAAFHARGIVDVTAGNNTVGFSQDGQNYVVQGFDAVRGYDLATGLGTVDGAWLVKELATPFPFRRHHHH